MHKCWDPRSVPYQGNGGNGKILIGVKLAAGSSDYSALVVLVDAALRPHLLKTILLTQ